VAKQFFDRSDVNSRHDEVTDKGVPEIVESEILDTCPPASDMK
jgi:hypothetical protein